MEIVIHLCACFPGWTIEYVLENIDFPTLKSINQYLEKNPPIHLMIASYFGLYDKNKKSNNNSNNQQNNSFNPMHLFADLKAKQTPFMNKVRRI
jgi:hypothetical protein